MIRDDYKVNKSTLALLPAKAINYDTIAWEDNQTIYVRQTPLDIIKESCLVYGSSYEGRREAVTHNTSYQRNLPIQISGKQHIYTFPTQAPKSFDCHWIFSEHILQIIGKNGTKEATICFKNNQLLPLTVSHYILNKQFHRTLTCMLHHLRKK